MTAWVRGVVCRPGGRGQTFVCCAQNPRSPNWVHAYPEGPKIEKIQDFAPGLKLSSDQSRIEIFNRDWKFQASHTARPLFVGIYQGRDWNFQSRLKISIEIENFKPGLKFSSVWIENFTRSIGIDFFQSLGPLGKGAYGNIAFWEGFWEGSGQGSGGRVLRRVLRRGSAMGFAVKKGSKKGSQKGFWEGGFQKVPRTTPLRSAPPKACALLNIFVRVPGREDRWPGSPRNRLGTKCLCAFSGPICQKVGVQETVLLVNHALARGTPAIFVIFVVSRGLSSKALVLLVRMQIRHFAIFVKKPFFLVGQKHGLPKGPFSGPRKRGPFWRKRRKRRICHSTHWKKGVSLLRTPENDKNGENGTRAKTSIRKSRVCSSLSFENFPWHCFFCPLCLYSPANCSLHSIVSTVCKLGAL